MSRHGQQTVKGASCVNGPDLETGIASAGQHGTVIAPRHRADTIDVISQHSTPIEETESEHGKEEEMLPARVRQVALASRKIPDFDGAIVRATG